jgi:hypothetical protein
MDEVEGLGVSNIELFSTVYTGTALSVVVAVPTPLALYRFKVKAISEQSLLSLYSNENEFIAAPIPTIITFPATIF